MIMIMRGPGLVFTHEAAYLGLSAFDRPIPIIMRKEIGQAESKSDFGCIWLRSRIWKLVIIINDTGLQSLKILNPWAIYNIIMY